MKTNFTNGTVIKLTVSHRYVNWTNDVYFSNYKEARSYAEALFKFKSILNGFTIRRLTLKDGGKDYNVQVLWHVRWVPRNQCIIGQPVKYPEKEMRHGEIAEAQLDEFRKTHNRGRNFTLPRSVRNVYDSLQYSENEVIANIN